MGIPALGGTRMITDQHSFTTLHRRPILFVKHLTNLSNPTQPLFSVVKYPRLRQFACKLIKVLSLISPDVPAECHWPAPARW